MEYNINKPWLTLDPWQKEYIEEKGNCFLLCGRQSGKTAAASIKFGRRAAENPRQIILMIALTEKQAYNLFHKTLMYLEACYPQMLVIKGRQKPTKHEIHLKNGSLIMCHAAGETGEGLRGYTLTSLVVDEAAGMSKYTFTSTTPALSVTGGTIDLLSTPRGKEGYFYEASLRDDFKKFYVSAEDCPRHKKEFLEAEKKSMSKLEYTQEYLAVFLDDLKRLFSDEWIEKVCILKRRDYLRPGKEYFIGVDIARLGEDESSFEILDRTDRKNIEQIENITTSKTFLTDTAKKIVELEDRYNFRQIYIDAGAGGLGVAVFDFLLDTESTKRKVVAINNREQPLNRDGTKKQKLLKEDLYNNLLGLGERGEIKLLDDDELIASLKSVQYEYVIAPNKKTALRIFGNYTHIAEGLIRAAWCSKDKTLNIWCA